MTEATKTDELFDIKEFPEWVDDSTKEGSFSRLNARLALLPAAIEQDVQANVLGRLERVRREAYHRGLKVGIAFGTVAALGAGFLVRALG